MASARRAAHESLDEPCGTKNVLHAGWVQAFLQEVVVAGDCAQLHVLAGRVFEACDAAKMPALDNRTAVGRAMTAVLRSCADPLREARELLDEGKQAGAHEERSAAVDADFEADECSPQV